MRIAVIGCGGFIGSHLLGRLLDLGYKVDGWDLESAKISHLINHPHFQFFNSDYTQNVQEIASSHSVVVHLAALCNPSLYNTVDELVIQSNFHHASLLADACAKTSTHFVYFSTSEVYGKTVPGSWEKPLTEDSSNLLLGPVSARRWSYACAKQLMERYLVALGNGRNLPWTIVRPFNFIGPGMDFIPGVDGDGIPRVLACFMDAWLHNKPMMLVDGGKNKRCFTWIGDAIDAIVKIMQRLPEANHQCFNIGNPENEVTIAELARLIKGIADIDSPLKMPEPKFVSAKEFYGEGYEDSDRRLPDISKAQEILAWSPQVSLREALAKTMDWYGKHYGMTR